MKFLFSTLLIFLSIGCVFNTFSSAATDPAPSPQLQLQSGPAQPPTSGQFEDIQDIYGPVPITQSHNLLLLIGLGIFALLGAVALFFFLKRRKDDVPLPTPGEIALAELKAARVLLEQGQSLSYVDRLSEILRHYIEKQFAIRSTRQTTNEFLHCLSRESSTPNTILQDHAKSLQHCLERCDMAKFAHDSPGRNGMDDMENSVLHFVHSTTNPEKEGVQS